VYGSVENRKDNRATERKVSRLAVTHHTITHTSPRTKKSSLLVITSRYNEVLLLGLCHFYPI